jgi:ubiquinone/menaquinone biosynthesis C-methylase UbiE
MQTRNLIQHQGHYRGVNRTNKISDFIKTYAPQLDVKTVLDIGCGDGSITNVVSEKLGLQKEAVHGCDINLVGAKTQNFSFSLVDETTKKLPYNDESFDVVYALMSLHHVRHLDDMLAEVRRVLKRGGLFIVREHDCRTVEMSLVLDIVHGFYSMVWSNPREFNDNFNKRYFAQYFSASDWCQIISSKSFRKLYSTEREESYPTYYKGKIVNPLRHYWSIYS